MKNRLETLFPGFFIFLRKALLVALLAMWLQFCGEMYCNTMTMYYRQNNRNMLDLGQDENGGGGNESIRTTREPNQSNSGRGNENGVEGEPVTPDGGSQNPSKGNNPQTDNGEQGIEGVPGGRANGSEDVSGSRAAAGGARGNQQGGQKTSDASQRGTGDSGRGRGRGTGGSGVSVRDKQSQGLFGNTSVENEPERKSSDEATERLKQQQQVKDDTPIKAADEANIAETLPLLYLYFLQKNNC